MQYAQKNPKNVQIIRNKVFHSFACFDMLFDQKSPVHAIPDYAGEDKRTHTKQTDGH